MSIYPYFSIDYLKHPETYAKRVATLLKANACFFKDPEVERETLKRYFKEEVWTDFQSPLKLVHYNPRLRTVYGTGET